ncbi:MAG: Xaa-Pro peptidase family protein [Nitrososphaeria archaeon]
MSISKDDYLRRIEEAKRRMKKDGIDFLIIYGDSWRDGNFRYFAGLSPFAALNTDYEAPYGPFSLLTIPIDGEPIYFVPDGFVDSITLEVEPIEDQPWIRLEPWSKSLSTLKGLKEKKGLKRIAFTGKDIVPYPIYTSIKEAMGEMIDSRIPDSMRIIKDEKEVKLLEKAGAIADRVYEDITETILKPGKMESEIAREIIVSAISYGADQVNSDILVMGGKYEETMLGKARDVPIRKGTMLEFHVTPRYQGYCCDLDRGIGFGKIPNEQRELLEVAKEAHEAAMKVMKPGVKGSEILKAAKSVNEELVGALPSLLYGHGIGIQFEENGFINEWMMEPGMTFTLAVGTGKKGVGAVRVEDVCTITKTGGRSLTNFDRACITE